MTDTFRTLCAEFVEKVNSNSAFWEEELRSLADRTNTALSQVEPVWVADEQLNELEDDYYWFDANHSKPWIPFARTVLDYFGNPPIKFIPASERLPEATDCDAEGRCWWWCPPDWVEIRNHESADAAFVAGATHWLPHWVLPLPEGGAA